MLGTHETIIKSRFAVLTSVLMEIQVSRNVAPVDIRYVAVRRLYL